MEILLSTTSHAAIISATDDRGDRRIAAPLPVILEADGSPVREQAVALREAGTSFANEAANIVATYTPNARIGQLRNLAARTLAKAVQRLMEAGQAEARAIAAAWARLIAVPVADATTAMLRQSDRTAFTALAMGDKAAWINHASVDQLSAIIEAGRDRANVTPEIWNHAEQRYAALNFIRIAGTAADHARQPTVDEPLATGVDMDAAERAANEGLDRHRQRAEIIDAVEQAVQGITNVVALTGEMDVRSAFALLTSGKVPA
jgi:hypothetical protein